MKKPTKTTSREAGARAPDRGAGHGWQGEAVERGSAPSSHEEPELAAARAEGNAPFPAEQARNRQRAKTDPTTFDLAGGDREVEDGDEEDEATAAELKRLAAAEEHAASTSKHPPHGRL